MERDSVYVVLSCVMVRFFLLFMSLGGGCWVGGCVVCFSVVVVVVVVLLAAYRKRKIQLSTPRA